MKTHRKRVRKRKRKHTYARATYCWLQILTILWRKLCLFPPIWTVQIKSTVLLCTRCFWIYYIYLPQIERYFFVWRIYIYLFIWQCYLCSFFCVWFVCSIGFYCSVSILIAMCVAEHFIVTQFCVSHFFTFALAFAWMF